VLIAGGYSAGINGGWFANSELYDPATETWTTTGALITGRRSHTASLLPNGKVLVAGGYDGNRLLSSTELYDPITGTWTATGTLTIARFYHTATLLPNGKVLIAGGDDGNIGLSDAELYDPVTGKWTATGPLATERIDHAATCLLNGKVLITGGYNYNVDGSVPRAQLYDVGLGFVTAWQPQIGAVNSPLPLGRSLSLTGSGFRGVSGGSGGNSQDSSTDYPLVQLRSLESGQTIFLSCTNWSTNSFTSTPVNSFPPGYALVTVFVNGIPSTSSVINVSVPVPTAPTLIATKTLTNGSFQFTFTNSVGAIFGVLTTTNVALPLTNWTALGGVTEISPGQFQFTDPQATNNPQSFSLIRSP